MGAKAKQVVIIAGPNGSGKTTFAREYLLSHPMEYLSADEIAEQLQPSSLEEVRLLAGRLFFQRVSEAIGQGRSFLAETTFAGKSFVRVLSTLRDHGYDITLVFLVLDSADACVARIRERVRKGGHAVPDVDVRRRYSRSISNFWHLYRPNADRWHLIYNSLMQPQEIAVGEAADVVVQDEDLYRLFLELVRASGNG